MIHTATQLKAKIRNISKGEDAKAKALIRIFFMERFLERVSLSKYRKNFILKGGMLVASLLGVNMRATMDIDTTVKALPLNGEDAKRIITEICNIPLEDGVTFRIKKVDTIMEDFDYSGVRLFIEASLEKMSNTIKIDISTDDVITPGAIEYAYKLMFEDRSIFVYTYNTETLLAEKLQTIINRGLANTRLRDYYDLCKITIYEKVDWSTLRAAFLATCKKRKTLFLNEKIVNEITLIEDDIEMKKRWNCFKNKNYFVGELEWDMVMDSVNKLISKIIEEEIMFKKTVPVVLDIDQQKLKSAQMRYITYYKKIYWSVAQ